MNVTLFIASHSDYLLQLDHDDMLKKINIERIAMQKFLKINFNSLFLVVISGISFISQAVAPFKIPKDPVTKAEIAKVKDDVNSHRRQLEQEKHTLPPAEVQKQEALLRDAELRAEYAENKLIVEEKTNAATALAKKAQADATEAITPAQKKKIADDTTTAYKLLEEATDAAKRRSTLAKEMETNRDSLDAITRNEVLQAARPELFVKVPAPETALITQEVHKAFVLPAESGLTIDLQIELKEAALEKVDQLMQKQASQYIELAENINRITAMELPDKASLERATKELGEIETQQSLLNAQLAESGRHQEELLAQLDELRKAGQISSEQVAKERALQTKNNQSREEIGLQLAQIAEARTKAVKASIKPSTNIITRFINYLKELFSPTVAVKEILADSTQLTKEFSPVLQHLEQLNKNTLLASTIYDMTVRAASLQEQVGRELLRSDVTPERLQVFYGGDIHTVRHQAQEMLFEIVPVETALPLLQKEHNALRTIVQRHLDTSTYETLFEQMREEYSNLLSNNTYEAYDILFSEPVLAELRKRNPEHFNAPTFKAENASFEDIGTAYEVAHSLALEFKMDEKLMPLVARAYDALSTPIARETYDAFLRDAQLLKENRDKVLTTGERELIQKEGQLSQLALDDADYTVARASLNALTTEISSFTKMQDLITLYRNQLQAVIQGLPNV